MVQNLINAAKQIISIEFSFSNHYQRWAQAWPMGFTSPLFFLSISSRLFLSSIASD